MADERIEIDDEMDTARAAALHATLGLEGPVPVSGNALPPYFHLAYFWRAEPPDQLGRDGHPARGAFIPDLGLPRRMWAGSRLRFDAQFLAGVPARKVSSVENIRETTGRSGPLAFVTLRHEITQNGHLAVTEFQDLVLRQDPAPDQLKPVPPPTPTAPEVRRSTAFSTVLLFRYSALTFNGHRIHYDEAYAREIEGYDGLVVHGPLLAQRLILLAVERLGRLQRFDFRATSVVTHNETVVLCGKGRQFWIEGADGRLCMEAAAE